MRFLISLILLLSTVGCLTTASSKLVFDGKSVTEDQKMLHYKYIDRNQKTVIDAGAFLSARSFSEGLAAVMVSEQLWGFIDKSGRLAIDPIYEEVGDFSEGLAAVRLPDDSLKPGPVRWIFIDKTGHQLIQAAYDVVHNFSENVSIARDGNAVYIVNREGKTRKLFNMTDLQLGPDISPKFKEGLLVVRDVKTKKYGFIDVDGKMIIPARFEDAAPFHENVARVTINEKSRELLGFVDKENRFLISPRFDIDFDFSRNSRDFSEGLAAVAPIFSNTTDAPPFVFINKSGAIVFRTTSLSVGKHRGGLAFFYDSKSAKYGYLDTSGQPAILPVYTRASDFSENLACVATDN